MNEIHLTREEACEELRCGLNTLSKLIKQGDIQAYSVSKSKTAKIWITLSSVRLFQNKGGAFYKATDKNMTFEQFTDGM